MHAIPEMAPFEVNKSVGSTNKGDTLPVSEIYGPVCQGEGALIGQQTIFVRLGGCDYRCVWCDSKYAVEAQYAKEWKKRQVKDIADRVMRLWFGDTHPVPFAYGPLDLPHVTLSGGNPAIHNLMPLMREFHKRGIRAAIETQGSTTPNIAVVGALNHVTLSPKPPSAENQIAGQPFADDSMLKAWVNACLTTQTPLCLKVVVFNDEDYAYLRRLHIVYPTIQTYAQAGTLVGTATRDDLCEGLLRLQDRILGDSDMRSVRPLVQLHAVLKGHARGI